MAEVTLLSGRLLRATAGAAGYDLFATETLTLWPGQRALVPTGVRTEMADGLVGLIRDRSGLSSKQGLAVLAGVVDPDYREEWRVLLLNTGKEPVTVAAGDRVAQVLFLRVSHGLGVAAGAELGVGPARDGGFGSTGS